MPRPKTTQPTMNETTETIEKIKIDDGLYEWPVAILALARIAQLTGHPYLSSVPNTLYEGGHMYSSSWNEEGKVAVTVSRNYFAVEASKEKLKQLQTQRDNMRRTISQTRADIALENQREYVNEMLIAELNQKIEGIEGGIAEVEANIAALGVEVEEETYAFPPRMPKIGWHA